jgi:ribosomal protein S18 acetylase RimI-like enzyme
LIIIHENQLENAIALSIQIPEFERPYEIEEYEKRLKGNHLILTAHGDETTFGFKIGYDRFSDGSFYSWMGGVLPEFRRQGVANTLADYQENWAKEQGYKSIKLKTRNKHESMITFAFERGFDIIDSESNEDIREMRIWLEKHL